MPHVKQGKPEAWKEDEVAYTLNIDWLSMYYWAVIITQGFPCGPAGKESACNAGDLGLISGLGRSPGEGKGYPLQYSGPENFVDCIVHGVTKSQTRLSDFRGHLWARPSTEWASQVALVVKNPPANAGDARDAGSITGSGVRKIPWSRKWQPALVFLPGKFHGQRNLVSYSPWVHGAAKSWTQLSDWAHFYWTDQIHACVLSHFSLIWLFVTPRL